MTRILSDSLLQRISDTANALEEGRSDEALRLLIDLDVTMTAIIDMVKVEDALSLMEASTIDLIRCGGK